MAGIIDAFLVTLGMDTSNFKHGVEEAKKGQEDVRESASHTAEYLSQQGEKAADFFKELLIGAGGAIAAFTSLNRIHEFTEEMAEADRETGRVAEMIGMSVEQLSSMQGAVKLADGTAQGLNQSLKSMGGMLIDIEKNLPRASRAMVVFQAAGVKGLALGKKTDILDVMDQLADKMHTMGYMEAMRLGQRMGLDEGTIRLMRMGREEIEKLSEEMGGLSHTTAADVEESERLEDAQKKLAQANEGIGRSIASVMRPALVWLTEQLEKIVKFVNEHKEAVRVAFIGIAAAMAVLGVIAAKAAIAVLAATWPLVAIALVVGLIAAGVAWLYNEWKKWTEGGHSSLAKLFEFIKAGWLLVRNLVITWFNVIRQTISDFVDYVVAYFQLLWAIFTLDGPGIQKAWEKLTTALGHIVERLLKFLVYEFFYMIGLLLKGWEGMWETMKKRAYESIMAIKKWWSELSPITKAALMAVSGGSITSLVNMGPGSGAALRPSHFSSVTGDRTSSQTVTIQEMNIQTQATDAHGIAADMRGAIGKTGLVHQVDTGIWG